MKIRPLYDRVIIKRLDAEDRTPGGLIIPENAKEKPLRGIVVAVGNGRVSDSGELRKPSVSEGDHVLFSKFSGQEIKVDGEDRLVVREEDILLVFDV
jgi:chaperonin GroES